MANKRMDKPCVDCGTMMYGVFANRLRCHDCQRRRENEAARIRYTGVKIQQEAQKKIADGMPRLERDVYNAEKRGMSYGKYKAWREGYLK